MRTAQISPALPPLAVIALGTASFGADISNDASFAMLDAYVAAGGNVLDTAHIYAAWLPGCHGNSERCLGQWIKARGCRDQVIISSKGGHPPMGSSALACLSPEQLQADLRDSLQRLDTAVIDLYWLHRDDPAVPVGEILDTLESLRASGKIRAYGASNWTTDRLDAAAAWATQHHQAGFCANQPGWALAERRADAPNVPNCLSGDEALRRWHEKTQLAVMAYTAQANGFFSKKPEQVPVYDSPTNRQRAQRARDLAAQLGSTANRVALAWLTSQRFPGIAIVGPKRVEQIADSMLAGDLRLSPDQVEWLYHGAQP